MGVGLHFQVRRALLCALIVGGLAGGNELLWGFVGKYNSVLSLGDQAPPWEPLKATDGQQYGSRDFDDAAVLVIVFTCNGCPYAVDYETRLAELAERFPTESKVKVVAINSNAIAEDSLEAMRQRGEERGFTFPYLKDESGAVAAAFGAVRTPEWFVLDAERKVIYMGAFDDASDITQVKQKYVEDAITAALASKPVEVGETAPVGCLIRKARRR